MKSRERSAKAFIVAVGILCWVLVGNPSRSAGPDMATPALSGIVSSQEEGRMEGVLVSATREGSPITVTVVSNSEGRYAFPSDRLQPGNYHLKIRAGGYDLEDPGGVKWDGKKTVPLDIKLHKTKDLASQLTNTEWIMSLPGTPEEKRFAMGLDGVRSCAFCHALSIPLQSKQDAKNFLSILQRMRTNSENSLVVPQRGMFKPVREPYTIPADHLILPGDEKRAQYLSSVNLSSGKRTYELKTLPRPTGRATRVIITEYDMPRPEYMPHDTVVDREGMVWYSDFGNPYVGRLDPRTGDIKQWPIPILKPGFPVGGLNLELDRDGNPWVALRAQGGIASLDRKTEKVTTYFTPPEPHDQGEDPTNPMNYQAAKIIAITSDNKIWLSENMHNRMYKLDPQQGRWVITYPGHLSGFGINIDSQDRIYGVWLGDNDVGEKQLGMLDAKTNKVEVYPMPPGSDRRRGDVDRQGRFWFAEWIHGKIGVFAPQTQQFKEWPVPPSPWSGPYDVVADKNGDVWAGGTYNDNISRLNPATGELTSYLLPTLETSIRRIDVDNSTTPLSVWVGETHQAKIARIEPLD